MCLLFFSRMSNRRGMNCAASIMWNVAETCGLKDGTLTCHTTWPNQISTAVGPLCQRMSWHLLHRESHDVQQPFILWIWVWNAENCIGTHHSRHPCSRAVCTPQSLESDQSDTAICASVKVNDYCTVDSSGRICVRLTTVSSNHESLNQNKHLGSIIPCWKPLIVSLQFTLSKAGLSTKLWTNALFLSRQTVHLRNTLP